MNVLTISGSARETSSNRQLLQHLSQIDSSHHYTHATICLSLPLYRPELDKAPWPESVLIFRQQVTDADAVIISTPAYIHTMPAMLKNSLEWLTSSGELMQKPVLAMTYTPAPPRGEKAMASLLWSLGALEARILASLPLYQTEVRVKDGKIEASVDTLEMLQDTLQLLQ